ncbi:H-NS histone family protein [Salmonella enterica]|nr:H-NS histone family protein [Salmonella enterica]
MNKLQEQLSTERALKKFLRESDFNFLEHLQKRILTVLDTRRAEYIELEKQAKQREEKRNELLQLIESEGFSLSDFIGQKPIKKATKRKPKYQYSENGETKYWSGVGRTPVTIQQALDSGKSLESFLIDQPKHD